jgi:hypothetical protein
LVRIVPLSVTTLQAATLGLDAAGGAILMHSPPERHDRARKGRRRHGRVGCAVRRRENAPLPNAAGSVAAFAGLGAVQHMRRNADRLRKIAPAGPALELFVIIAQIKQSTPSKAGNLDAFGGEALPEIEALGSHRQLARVPILLSAPTPVAARLLAADGSFLYQRDRDASPRQVISCENADDATADYHDVCRFR